MATPSAIPHAGIEFAPRDRGCQRPECLSVPQGSDGSGTPVRSACCCPVPVHPSAPVWKSVGLSIGFSVRFLDPIAVQHTLKVVILITVGDSSAHHGRLGVPWCAKCERIILAPRVSAEVRACVSMRQPTKAVRVVIADFFSIRQDRAHFGNTAPHLTKNHEAFQLRDLL